MKPAGLPVKKEAPSVPAVVAEKPEPAARKSRRPKPENRSDEEKPRTSAARTSSGKPRKQLLLNIPTETKRGIKLLGLIPRFVFSKTYLCTDMAKENVTPMMKQFYELKAKNPDAVMLFRCGDFYETYCEDAVTASKILGITLTKRNNKGQAAAIDMAGFPFHALDTYLPKLIRAGHRVAICDQLEDPKTTNKLVKRGITELVTPGVSMNDNVLNCKENNFLAAINFGRSTVGLSLLDISTGEFLVAEGVSDYIEKLLSNFSPKEVLYERGKKNVRELLWQQVIYVRNGRLDFCRDYGKRKVASSFSGEESERIWR